MTDLPPPDVPAHVLLGRLLGTGGTWADLFTERSRHVRIDLAQAASARRVQPPRCTTATAEVVGSGLRVLTGTEERFLAVGGDAPAALHAAAETLASPGRAADVPPLDLVHHDPPPRQPSDAERRDWVDRAADGALGLDPGVERVTVAYREHVRRVFVAGAGEEEATAAVTSAHHLALRVDVVLRVGGRRVAAYAVHGAPGVEAFLRQTPERVAAEAIARARRHGEAQRLSAGPYPVVIAPGWGAVWMHEAIGHRLEADVHATAPLGVPGARVAAAHVSFTDDPTLPGGRGTYAYDDEATPARPAPLVEHGRLCGLVTDRRHGGPRCGHGRRQDYRHPPLPRSANLRLAPGSDRPAALVADVGDGLYVAAVGGGFVRPADDRFGFEVLDGYRIERGRCTAPVTGLWVEGSVRAALAGITGVADDLQLDAARGLCRKHGQVVPVSVAAPTVAFSALSVRPGAA